MKSFINNKKNLKYLFYFLGVVFIFFVWSLASWKVNNSYVIPSVFMTFESLGKLFIDVHTYEVLGFTFTRLFLVIMICFTLGVLLAGV